jgi:oxygen-independent coproporphyrinogen-3 oxidase
VKQVAAGTPVHEERRLGRADAVFEFMMNALRLRAGFPVALFRERTGLEITAAERGLAKAESLGLISRDSSRIVPTERGRRFLNDLLGLFLPEPDAAGKAHPIRDARA